MAEIPRKREQVIPTGGQISLGAAAAPGLAQADAGAALSRLGQAYFDEASQSVRTATYADVTNKATLEFNERLQERLTQLEDKNGNPTFQQLPDDIGKIGQDILNKYSSKILDPEVQSKFRNDFSTFITNRQISGLAQGRAQMHAFQREKVASSLQGFISQAQQAPSAQIAEYKGKVDSILNSMVASGAITPSDRFRLQEQFRTQVIGHHIRQQIQADPNAAHLQLLANDDPLSKSLTENERKQFLNEADKAINDQQRAIEKNDLAEKKQRVHQQSVAASQLSTGISEGIIGEKQLEESRNNGAITELQYQQLRRKLITSLEAENKANKTNLKIAEDIKNQVSLAPYSQSQINKYYLAQVKVQVDQAKAQNKEINLVDKAAIALSIKAPVSVLSEEIDAATRFGDLSKAEEALKSYSFLSDQNPEAISKLPSKSAATLATARVLVESSNMSYGKAMQVARKKVFERTPEILAERQASLAELKRKGGPLSRENIQGTIRDFAEKELLKRGLLTRTFTRQPQLAPGLTQRLSRLLDEAYIATGDLESAKKMVANWISSRVGVSKVNGEDTIMMFPPEKVTGATTEAIKQDLKNSAQKFLPNDQKNAEIRIHTDELTNRENAQGQKIFMFPVSYIDKNGLETPLTDEKGNIVRYSPDSKQLQIQENDRRVSEAVERRNAEIGISGQRRSRAGIIGGPGIRPSDERTHKETELPPGKLIEDPKGGNNMSQGTGKSFNQASGRVQSAISEGSDVAGVNPDALAAIAKVESNLNPNAKARTSSASGLFQFIRSTWAGMVKKYGKQTGITMADRFDPKANAIMGALFTRDNGRVLKKTLGRNPRLSELYLAHFSGVGKAKRVLQILQRNPNAHVSEAYSPAEIRANRSILKGGLRESVNRLTRKVIRANGGVDIEVEI